MATPPPLPAPVDPQAAGLLSLARLNEIELVLQEMGEYPTLEQLDEAAANSHSLLWHIAARNQQVAAELRLLLTDPAIFPQLEPANRVSAYLRNTQVHNAARALGLTL